MTYIPQPIDTRGVVIHPGLLDLVELLARNTHETWSQGRIDDGWTWGQERSDSERLHPCLIPYENLSEEEKEYDRRTALETIRLILAMGYELLPPKESTDRQRSSERPEDALTGIDLTGLLRRWDNRDPAAWAADPAWYRIAAERLLRFGEPLLAYDAAQEGLRAWPTDVRLRQLLALSLARSGAGNDAAEILEALREDGQADEETLGLLGRVCKDRWNETGLPEDLERARSAYFEAWDRSGGVWSGINCATLARLAGDKSEAVRIADRVRKSMAGAGNESEDYWVQATLGESWLVEGKIPEARLAYEKSVKLAGERWGDLRSTWRQARILLDAIDATDEIKEDFTRLFAVPRVSVFIGGEAPPPDDLINSLNRDRATIGYAVIESAGDIDYLEAMTKIGGQTNILLTVPPDRLYDADTLGEFRQRIEPILARAAEITVLPGMPEQPSPADRTYARHVAHGLAGLRAAQLETELVPFGGEYTTTTNTHDEPKVRALLFADTVNFSRLREHEYPLFVDRVLGLTGKLLEQSGIHALHRNTWGDALYLVFEHVAEAGKFALDLQEAIESTSWEDLGLRMPLRLRIALHAGPVRKMPNPVTGDTGYVGSHVCRAARMEPITPPGQVFASLEFAALATAENAEEFKCRYVGRMAMPKRFGIFPTFHVMRT